jgi:hypothetical protein
MTPTLREAAQRALHDAASSLETIGRLAGKTHYLGDNGEKIETCMEYHDQVRGYAKARASVAREAIAALANEPQTEPHIPTPDDIDAQDWAGMDGAIAYHLIERHSENWSHAARLMHAWRDANPPAAEQPGAVGLSERDRSTITAAINALQNPKMASIVMNVSAVIENLRGMLGRAALAAAQPADQWVPVIDRLPPEGVPVLIAAYAWGSDGGERIYGVAKRIGDVWLNPQDTAQDSEWWPATHWRPLDPPPAATQAQDKGDAA